MDIKLFYAGEDNLFRYFDVEINAYLDYETNVYDELQENYSQIGISKKDLNHVKWIFNNLSKEEKKEIKEHIKENRLRIITGGVKK